MRRYLMLLILIGLLLSACGGPSAASTAETDVSPQDTPEVITKQLLTALAAQDSATVLRLFDAGMPARQIERERLVHDWTTRQQSDSSGLPCPTTLGPLKGQDTAPAVVTGTTAKVRTTLHHEKGDAWLDVSLRQTPDGWRVFEWSSRNICAGMK